MAAWWAAAGWPGRKAPVRTKCPPWLVFGAMIRTAAMTDVEPGANPLVTNLAEEGFS